MAGPLPPDPADDPADNGTDGVLGWLPGPKKVPDRWSGPGRTDLPAT
jgi:hypothetical protein